MRTQFIIFIMMIVLLACSKSEDVNLAPNQPTIESPVDGATCETLRPSLSWKTTDPENDELTYTLWMGTSENDLSIISDNIQHSGFIPNENLKIETKYYWQVAAYDGNSSTKSNIASFSTTGEGESGVLPSRPIIVTPKSNVSAGDISFTWHTATGGVGTITYSLYVKHGAASDFSLLNDGISNTSYTQNFTAGNLSWYVEAADSRGQLARSSTVSLIIN